MAQREEGGHEPLRPLLETPNKFSCAGPSSLNHNSTNLFSNLLPFYPQTPNHLHPLNLFLFLSLLAQ